MKNSMVIFTISYVLFCSCGEDCVVGRSNYTFEVTIAGEARKAIIVRPVNECLRAPILFIFHGRGGTAKNSQAYYQFHNIDFLDHMYIVYTEGTNYDNGPDGTNGWVIRFPHISTECANKNKDIDYIQAIIDHLALDDKADIESMGAFGFSNGGFFTLSLAALQPNTFKGFASLGSYTSYAPSSSLIDCNNSYENAIDKSQAAIMNASIRPKPVPTLFIFGNADSTLHGSVPSVYIPDCTKFSYFQNSVLQLCIKNKSEMPNCAVKNFMTTFSRQIFPAKTGGAETQVQVYNGDHSWPPEAGDWVAEFFAELLYP